MFYSKVIIKFRFLLYLINKYIELNININNIIFICNNLKNYDKIFWINL
jgi:hypothetical protein